LEKQPIRAQVILRFYLECISKIGMGGRGWTNGKPRDRETGPSRRRSRPCHPCRWLLKQVLVTPSLPCRVRAVGHIPKMTHPSSTSVNEGWSDRPVFPVLPSIYSRIGIQCRAEVVEARIAQVCIGSRVAGDEVYLDDCSGCNEVAALGSKSGQCRRCRSATTGGIAINSKNGNSMSF
jgi:hypothetical protein